MLLALLILLVGCCAVLIGGLVINNRMLTRANQEVAELVLGLRHAGSELEAANADALRAAEEIGQQNRVLQERDHRLALQNTRFEAALNNMSQALCMVDPDGRLIVCNPQFDELFGIARPSGGIPVAALFADIVAAGRYDPDQIGQIWRRQQGLTAGHRAGGFVVEGHGMFSDAKAGDILVANGKAVDGLGRTLAVSHRPMEGGGWVATYADITERRTAQRQLVQAQKMEAIGNLTGGMAHDFNNLLAVISLNVEFLLSRPDDTARVREHGGRALQASLRGADLISQLLAFARRQPLEPKRIGVNTWIRSIASLLEHMLGASIEIRLRLGEDIWPVNADATRLETAIANLATNARDAMKQGGTLTILTANRQMVPGDADADAELGEYVMIEVSDTGIGMEQAVAARIFEPFFTTKGEGHGTGLGLSMVFGFIRQSGGHITVASQPGQGTVFRLFLPRADGAPVVERPVDARPPPSAIGGSETILVVEDNEAVRQVTADLLDHLGYTVLQTSNAQEALALLEGLAPVDLLFSDVVMPGGIDGFALVNQAVSLRPGLRALLASGYVDGTGAGQSSQAPARLLGKPFRQSELARVVREILDD